MPSPAEPDWSLRCREALARYSESLLRTVADKLVRPRTKMPADELLDKAAATLTNAPVIDRRIKDQPTAARKLLALIGLSRQPRWKVGHLATLLAALDHAEGYVPIQTLLENCLLFPELDAESPPINDFPAWLAQSQTGTHNAVVFVHPIVAARGSRRRVGLAQLGAPRPRGRRGWRKANGWPRMAAAARGGVAAGSRRPCAAHARQYALQTRLAAASGRPCARRSACRSARDRSRIGCTCASVGQSRRVAC